MTIIVTIEKDQEAGIEIVSIEDQEAIIETIEDQEAMIVVPVTKIGMIGGPLILLQYQSINLIRSYLKSMMIQEILTAKQRSSR